MKAKVTLFRNCVFVFGAALLGATSAQAGTLPDVTGLTKNSDYSVFMQDGVPAEVRTQALRKLWRSNPVIAGTDDLSDYGDDYRMDGDSVVSTRTVARSAASVEAQPVAGLPPIESLNGHSSYAAFMQPGVPAEVRTQALRKLWRSNPVIAGTDDLSDYGDDYRTDDDDVELAGTSGKAPSGV